jgi:hypothetical protein
MRSLNRDLEIFMKKDPPGAKDIKTEFKFKFNLIKKGLKR